jgi:hypothetical protein
LADGLRFGHDRISGQERVVCRPSRVQKELEGTGEASFQKQSLSHRFFGSRRAGWKQSGLAGAV